MHKSISLALLLTACDSDPSDNYYAECISRCSSDSSIPDNSIDIGVDANVVELPYPSTIFATAATKENDDAFLTVAFNFENNTLNELINDQGSVFTDSKSLIGFTRPSFSPSGNKLVYNKTNGEEHSVYIYNLRNGDLKSITSSYSNSQVIWKNEDTIFLTRGGHTPQGLQTLGVYEVNVNSGNAQEIVALPLQPRWTLGMGIAYDSLIDLLYFSCLPKDVLPTTEAEQDEPEDEVYHTPWEICSIYGSQRDGIYGQKTNLQGNNLLLLSPFLSLRKEAPLSLVYAACTLEDKVGYCSGNLNQNFSFEVEEKQPTYLLTFDPTSQYAATMSGHIYDFSTQEWFSLNDLSWKINGEEVIKIMPFAWR